MMCAACLLLFLPHQFQTLAGDCSMSSPPIDCHHQQQTQQTFHLQLLRLAFPDATNIEAARTACGQQPDPHRRREGRR